MGRSSAEPRPGFDHWVSFRGQGVYTDPTLNVDSVQLAHEGYMTDLRTEYAPDWLRNKTSDDQPFFLCLSHKALHADFEPAPRHEGTYEDVIPPRPETMANTESNYRGTPEWVKAQRYSWHGVDHMYHGAFTFNDFYRRYAETLLALDESVGRVLDYLEASGRADDTIVLYMGDNGFLLGEHGLIDKRNAYEASIRVPMLAWAPGIVPADTTITSLVRNIDVAPTILDLAGAPSLDTVDGRSFRPMLEGVPTSDDRAFLYEYYWEYTFPHTPTTFALRGDRYKLIMYHGIWDQNEFYDLQADPIEQHNLIHNPVLQDTIQFFQTRLFKRLRATGGMQIPLRPMEGRQADERLRDAE